MLVWIHLGNGQITQMSLRIDLSYNLGHKFFVSYGITKHMHAAQTVQHSPHSFTGGHHKTFANTTKSISNEDHWNFVIGKAQAEAWLVGSLVLTTYLAVYVFSVLRPRLLPFNVFSIILNYLTLPCCMTYGAGKDASLNQRWKRTHSHRQLTGSTDDIRIKEVHILRGK
jgi:hypothetical protein